MQVMFLCCLVYIGEEVWACAIAYRTKRKPLFLLALFFFAEPFFYLLLHGYLERIMDTHLEPSGTSDLSEILLQFNKF